MKRLIIFLISLFFSLSIQAAVSKIPNTPPASKDQVTTQASSPLVAPAPDLNAAAYALMDANTGKILAQKNMNKKLQPGSLTKLMALYLVFHDLQNHTIKLTDEVPISKKAWQTGGSKMFVRVGNHVPVQLLIQGVIVDSGNDATVALAEYVGGTESSFVNMMNQEAQALGMKDTHFMDSTGLPDPQHYTTAYDLALLTRAIIQDYPEYYHFFSEKWLTYDKIKQPNRNRLLWRFHGADGLKTGHTDEAGYCLIGSAVQNNTRLISVVLGTPTDEARANDSEALLRYGFRYFKTQQVLTANKPLEEVRVWDGDQKTIPVGVTKAVYITVVNGQKNKVDTQININKNLTAPIKLHQQVGTITVSVDGKTVTTEALVALQADDKGGVWRRSSDAVSHKWDHWFSKKKD